jgi:hypothetical protein
MAPETQPLVVKIEVIFRGGWTDDISSFYKGIPGSPFLLASTRSELNLMATGSKNSAYFKDWGYMLLSVLTTMMGLQLRVGDLQYLHE